MLCVAEQSRQPGPNSKAVKPVCSTVQRLTWQSRAQRKVSVAGTWTAAWGALPRGISRMSSWSWGESWAEG